MGALTVGATRPLKHSAIDSRQPLSLGLQCEPALSLFIRPKQTYALSLNAGNGRLRTLHAVLQYNLSRGARCALMTPIAPETFLQRLDKPSRDHMEQSIGSGQLTLLTMIGEYSQHLVRFGPEKLTKEWEQCGITRDTLLIIDHAEQIFSLHHHELLLAQINVYRRWIEEADCSALFVFSGWTADGQAAGGQQRVMDTTSGSARIDCRHLPATLWIDFWDAGSEMLSEQRLEWLNSHATKRDSETVQRGTSGWNNPVASEAMEPLPADIEDIFYLGGEPVAIGGRQRHNWRYVHDLIDLLHATREARAATVLIHVSRQTNWLHLAQAVHTMRQRCGAYLRIAIIDPDKVMRYQNELLLLNLGANAVVHGQAAIASRLPLLLQSLRSQRYVSTKAVNFDKAVDSATPPDTNGYLRPEDFYREVLSALAKSSILDIPCALLAWPVPHGRLGKAAVGNVRLSRQGDLLTANSTHCFAFLYGCAGMDLHSLIPRLLEAHDPQLVPDISIMSDEDAIVAVLSTVEDDKWVLDQVLSQVEETCAPHDNVAAGAN